MVVAEVAVVAEVEVGDREVMTSRSDAVQRLDRACCYAVRMLEVYWLEGRGVVGARFMEA